MKASQTHTESITTPILFNLSITMFLPKKTMDQINAGIKLR
jgi:hypothetical protein